MSRKMIATNVIGAADKTTRVIGLIKPDVLATNSGHQLGPHFLSKLGSVNRIKVVQDGPIWLVPAIEILTRSPSHLALHAGVMFEQNIGAETGIRPSRVGREKCAGRIGCA